MHAEVHREADRPSEVADPKHPEAQLPGLVGRAAAGLNGVGVVVEDVVGDEAHGDAGEVPEGVLDELVHRVDVGQDGRRRDVAENLLVQDPAHRGTKAEDDEGDEVEEKLLAAVVQGLGLRQDEEKENEEGDAAGH
mmetsp:Transcript_89567/g.175298  ORF Transcript_89567/g.175298 Transcript_89567/m.175298 type:complete len:136 (-) Transcript_89567:126-533(-)